MCFVDPNCTTQGDELEPYQYITLICLCCVCALIYLTLLTFCISNIVQYLVNQKRYSKILLSAFYITAFICLVSTLASSIDSVYGFTMLYLPDRSIDVPNLRCTIDFKLANQCTFIATLAKLTLGYF